MPSWKDGVHSHKFLKRCSAISNLDVWYTQIIQLIPKSITIQLSPFFFSFFFYFVLSCDFFSFLHIKKKIAVIKLSVNFRQTFSLRYLISIVLFISYHNITEFIDMWTFSLNQIYPPPSNYFSFVGGQHRNDIKKKKKIKY